MNLSGNTWNYEYFTFLLNKFFINSEKIYRVFTKLRVTTLPRNFEENLTI